MSLALQCVADSVARPDEQPFAEGCWACEARRSVGGTAKNQALLDEIGIVDAGDVNELTRVKSKLKALGVKLGDWVRAWRAARFDAADAMLAGWKADEKPVWQLRYVRGGL